MTLEPWQWALAVLAALIVGISKSGIGGLGILAVVLFTLMMPAKQATGTVLPLLCFGDIVASVTYGRHAKWLHVWRLFPWTAGGVVLGWLAFDRVNDRQAQGLAELLGQAGHLGTAAGDEDASGLAAVGAATYVDEATIDVLREAADERLRVGLEDGDLRVGFGQLDDAGEVTDLDRFGDGERLAGVIGDALREEVAANVGGRLDVDAAGADETERGRTGADVDDEDFLGAGTAGETERLTVEQRGGLNRHRAQAG